MTNIDEHKVFLQRGGKTEALREYVLVSPHSDDMNIFIDATLFTQYSAALMVWDQFIKSASRSSDAELYDLCEYAEIEYDALMDIVRKERKSWTE